MVSLLEFTVAVAPLCLSIHQHVDQCVIIYPMHPIQRQLTLLRQQRLRLREKVGTHPLRLGRPLALTIIWHQLSLDAVHGTEPQLQGTRKLDDYQLTYLHYSSCTESNRMKRVWLESKGWRVDGNGDYHKW